MIVHAPCYMIRFLKARCIRHPELEELDRRSKAGPNIDERHEIHVRCRELMRELNKQYGYNIDD